MTVETWMRVLLTALLSSTVFFIGHQEARIGSRRETLCEVGGWVSLAVLITSLLGLIWTVKW